MTEAQGQLLEPVSEPVVTPGNSLLAAPGRWLGDAPHVVMAGSVDGRDFDVEVRGGLGLTAKREYGRRGDRLVYVDFEVALVLTTGGITRRIELEFENADFASHALPCIFTLQTTPYPDGPQTTLEVELEWDGFEAEVDGWRGALHLARDDAPRGGAEMSAAGMIGGHLHASRGDDWLIVSFTAPVTEADLD